MFRFTYSRGQWSDGIDLPEWGEGEEFDSYLERLGFSPSKMTIGWEHGSCIDIYENDASKSFLASVSPRGTTCYEVLLPDFPSLMMFMRDFGPTFAALNVESDLSEIRNVIDKFFRATHGHDASDICRECAPYEWAARQRRREEARSASTAAAGT